MLKRAASLVPDGVLLLAARVLDALRRRRRAPIGLALVYHRVAPQAGDPSRELLPAIATEDFAAQVAWVRRRYRPVRAGELVDAAERRRPGEPLPVAITFDDDSDTHHRHAREPLAGAGVPATFFLCGGTLDGPRGYWWEDLQALHDRGELDGLDLPALEPPTDDLFSIALQIEVLDAATREAVAAALRRRVGAPVQTGLPAEAVRDLVADGHEIGFHTRDHHTLTTLDDEQLHAALRDGRDALAAVTGSDVRTIAYPNGRHDERTVPAAREAGYVAGFTTSGFGWTPGTEPLLIGRVEPRSPSLGVFALKLALAAWGRGG